MPDGLALDPAAGKIYWANFGTHEISWAYLNGRGGGEVFTGTATVLGPSGVALDLAGGKIYWANYVDATNTPFRISDANLDGSGGADLNTTGATVEGPRGVALDPAARRIYWANANGPISYANLDGSGGGDLPIAPALTTDPIGIAIDPTANRVYWTDYLGGTISFARLDGSDAATLNTSVAVSPAFPVLLRGPASAATPAITGGSAPGAMLSCSSGKWAPDLEGSFLYRAPRSFAYQWIRDGIEIDGATSNMYAATQDGDYRCRVTASNAAGSVTQISAAHTVAPTPPPPPPPPSGGPAGAGGSSGSSGSTQMRGPTGARCVVPRLRHMTIAQARRALRRAHCELGTVRVPKSARRHHVLRVASESAAPLTRHRAGYRVGITVR